MRLYLSTSEAGVLIGSLVMAYTHADEKERTDIDTLLKRIDVCLTLQGQPKEKEGGKKSEKPKRG